MRDPSWLDARRLAPRVDVETFCTELVGHRDCPGLVVDLSPTGARIERPYRGGATPEHVLLELELPELDEIVWARGAVCFDQVRQAPPGRGGALGLLRTTGVRLVTAAARDLRLLRDCVFELRRLRTPAPEDDWGADLLGAACYARA